MKNKNVQLRCTRVLKSLVACTLIISILACSSLNAFAAEKKEYISELKFSSADTCSKDEAKEYLTDNGYKIASEEYDLGFNDALYLGYKTTTNPKEAITDISVMNMNGGFSFSEYEKLVKEQKEAMSKIITVLYYGVKEYRDNYAAGSPAAKYAYDMMNSYKEDDSGKLMGDFLLDDKATEKQMITLFSQASGIHLAVIKQNLALACTPYGKDEKGNDKVSWMERLSKLGAKGVTAAYNNDANNVRAITLKQVFSLIAPDLKQYLTVQESIDSIVGVGDFTKEQEEQAIKIVNENYTPETKITFSQSATSYAILKNFKYEDTAKPEIKTLADLVLKSQELESFDFHAMASVLTEAEYQMMSLVGPTPFINISSNTEENWKKIRSDVSALKIKDAPVTSIYDGVDRELFNGKVAMTSESIRNNNMNSDNNMLYGNINNIAEISMLTLMATSAATMIGAGIFAGITKAPLIIKVATFTEYGANAAKMVSVFETFTKAEKAYYLNHFPQYFSNQLTAIGRVFFSAMGILAIVMIVFAALEISYFYQNDYTAMPLIMIDSVMQKDAEGAPLSPALIKYNAITQQSMNIQDNYIADLNTFKGNQWLIMYTTKDKLAGAPILAKNFNFARTATYPDENVSPIHRFGETSPYDLKNGAGFSLDLYGSFERDPEVIKTEAEAAAASSISFNFTTALAIALGAIVGGVASVFSTLAIVKRRKRGNSLAG
ncbi:MAG: hypothetical protein RR306_06190 [Clostridia bacterium]